MKLFQPFQLGNITLSNRIVMAPMTRSRAYDNIPNDLMAEYYRQRASAGLIITEGVAPSANGLGYPRIPGSFTPEQVEGWKKITKAVHEEGGKIFMQLMHTGRVGHPLNMQESAEVLAPSAIGMSGQMYTDQSGMQDYPVPRAMTTEEVLAAQEEFVLAAINAIDAGFDGIELHGANGYLIDQFINTASNKRTDAYGGSLENRSRFALETADKVAKAIGPDKTGIRLSPYGVYNDMEIFEDLEQTFTYLAEQLGKLDLAYIHIVDHSSQGAPDVPVSIKLAIGKAFGGAIIASGGLDKTKAEEAVENNVGNLVAFGRPILATPDLVYRMQNDLPLNEIDYSTMFTPGEKGYTDYPFYGSE